MKKSSIFVALIMMSFACASTLAQHCKLHFQMRNKSRHIWGAPWNAECRGSVHSAPLWELRRQLQRGQETKQ